MEEKERKEGCGMEWYGKEKESSVHTLPLFSYFEWETMSGRRRSHGQLLNARLK
jgi:hypothetical protein